METRREVCEKREIAWEHEVRVFSRNFKFFYVCHVKTYARKNVRVNGFPKLHEKSYDYLLIIFK